MKKRNLDHVRIRYRVIFSTVLSLSLLSFGLTPANAGGSTTITYSTGNSSSWSFSDYGINDVSTTSTAAGDRSDAYDGAMALSVCQDTTCTYTGGSYTAYSVVGTYDSNLRTYNGTSTTINGLNVTAKMRLSASLVAGRMLASFQNTSGATISRVIKIYSNLGSDGSTSLKYTSSNQILSNQTLPQSGNTNFWSISAQDSGLTPSAQAASDPINSYVWGTPNASVIGNANINNGDINWTYTLNIPANTTQSILFVFGLGEVSSTSNTYAGALSGVTTHLDAYTKLPSDMMNDLTSTEIATIQNWVIAPSPSGFTSTQASPTNTLNSFTYSMNMTQSITGLASGDFSNAGTATGCTFTPNTSSGSTFTITVSGCGEGTVRPQLLANSVTGTQTGPTVNSPANTIIIIDRTSPTISSVTTTNGTYTPSSNTNLNFTTTFSESVTVTGQPQIPITIGSTSRNATFISLTDSRTATFRYTVTANSSDVDTDGIEVSTTLNLNSGSISDLAGNSLTPLTFTAPVTTGVLVAQTPEAPTIDSITATNGQLAVAFTPGAANGSAITNYEFSTNNGVNWTMRSPIATTSPLTITGLTNGQSYNVRLRAINAAGSGESSTAVSATPTAVAVTGDSTLALTYGASASTSAYSATGGTNTYTWSLGSTLTGITLSGTTVTAGPTTPAGTYSQSVRATDGNNQVGSKSLTITVNKASTSITISLPNSATDAALGGAVTITATVPRAGAVNFRLGGTTISGCGLAAAATTTATCSWTPASLGSVSLTAIFTPTDTSNFETSTSTTLSITVVNGVSTVTLSLAGGTTTPPKGQAINIIATVDQAGRITFLIDGKRIPGCFNRNASVGNVTCSWKPAVQKAVTISARLTPSNNVYNASTSNMSVQVVRRSGAR